MNLLIVNDEKYTAETMRDMIFWEQYGIDMVYTAFSAEEGRRLLREQNIHIMLCDIEMPGENGISLIRWTREHTPEVKCLLLTCHASFSYAQDAVRLGCLDYILMPARYEEIGAAVKRVVQDIAREQEEQWLRDYGKATIRRTSDTISQKDEPRKSPQQIVRETKEYILAHLSDETLSVESIANQFFLHPVYLNRIFKRETGKPISHFLTEERMRLADQLLKEGNVSAHAVAQRVGYKNYSNFFSMYKKFFGYSPKKLSSVPDSAPENRKENNA